MTKIYQSLLFIYVALNSFIIHGQNTLIFRSEYEKVGDVIGDLNLTGEGNSSYSIVSGNADGYYDINSTTGQLTIAKEIPDQKNSIRKDLLTVGNSATQTVVEIVDGYDYFIQKHPGYTVLEAHNQTYLTTDNPYTVFNNLWGKGNALPGLDFRMATLYNSLIPDQTVFLWDVPSKASDFNGASVWSYMNIMWGNRKNIKEDLTGFPIQIASIQSLNIDFDFEQLFGTEDYKIALNHFLTDENYIAPFGNNDGDFFMVFDQIGDWIPSYPVNIGDTIINDASFTRLYKKDVDTGYEYRRVIIKDEEKLLKGTIDMKSIYNSFSSRAFLNKQQYIPNIQLGLEITDGFGAVRINQWDIKLNKSTNTAIKNNDQKNMIQVYPNPSSGHFKITAPKENTEWIVYDLLGNKVTTGRKRTVDLKGFPKGIYLLSFEGQCIKLVLE